MRITVAGKPADILSTLPAVGWSLDRKGYVIYTSRKTNAALTRGKKAHIAAMETLLGGPLPEGFHIHHMDFNKLNNLPWDLVLMPAAFNPSSAKQCPYTGRMISAERYFEAYGMRRAA